MNFDNRDKDNQITAYPHTFFCGECRKKHTALAFSDLELDYIDFVLSIHRESLVSMLHTERSKRERDYLKGEIQYTAYVSEKVNFKECTCKDCQSDYKNER